MSAAAAALATVRRAHRDEGGYTLFKTHPGPGHIVPHHPRIPGAPTRLHIGPIHSVVAGRTDHLPVHVPSGSYVIPADVVSHHGEGSTIAGFKVMRRVFGGGPYGQGSGPYGSQLARGGTPDEGVPVVLAGGEYVVPPQEVRRIGGGDLDAGHRVLDEFVLRSRAELIKTLRKLPGPAKG